MGVGAGAGGLEAIQLLFGGMPVDSKLAFVICRHVKSGLSDPLADLLCTQTAMPVIQASNGTMLEAGRIHLVAPDARMILLKDRLVCFSPETDEDAELDVSPIDILLHSLAASAGPAAIAVMLSGRDQDGLRGCASIKSHGGLVLAQHPESTEFAEMPRRVIEADLASAAAPPGAIADLIRRHVAKTETPEARPDRRAGDDAALARIVDLLEARFDIDAHAYRPTLVAKRVRRRLAISRAASLADYAARLAKDDVELTALHDDLLIRVTAFFRNPEAFAVLERDVVPVLVGRMSEEQPIRIWIPACASGEEAYSLAMLILNRIERTGKTAHLEILASDRHVQALKQARAGRYRRDRLNQAPPGLIERYWRGDGDHVEAGPALRRHVTFVDHDMLKAPPPDDIDLVSCRNLLIYLAAAPREKALLACCEALKPDGFLFLGPSEQPGPQLKDVNTVNSKWRIYRKAGSPPVDDTLARLAAAHRQASSEAITLHDGDNSQPPDPKTPPGPPNVEPPHELDGVMMENQRMLESTIDTLLASNDSLRRRNRDLRAENQRLTHAHAALDDIATMIAHDLKAPLRTIDRLTTRLRTTLSGSKPDGDAMRCLRPMQHQLLALNRLIDDLLTYARQGPADATDRREVNVTDLLRETLTLVGLPAGVRVMMRPPSLKVMTWRIPLACILRNLLGQAIERVGDSSGTIRIEATPGSRFLEIAIEDDGRHACDRTSELGLAIVRQLLDTAGGRLTSSSDDAGHGHQVQLTWPIDGTVEEAP